MHAILIFLSVFCSLVGLYILSNRDGNNHDDDVIYGVFSIALLFAVCALAIP